MDKQAVEDLFVEFDELGFEPTILCDSKKEVLDHFHNQFKEILKDYDEVKQILAERYLLRVMLWQLLGQADLTLEKPEIGGESIHVKLDACELFWTGWGVYWLKENFSYKIKNIKEEKEK